MINIEFKKKKNLNLKKIKKKYTKFYNKLSKSKKKKMNYDI